MIKKYSRHIFIAVCIVLFLLILFLFSRGFRLRHSPNSNSNEQNSSMALTSQAATTGPTKSSDLTETTKASYIKWVTFNVPEDALNDTLTLDIQTHGQKNHISWIDSLAYLACKNGQNWNRYKKQQLDEMYAMLIDGTTINTLMSGNKYYTYYQKAYTAVLGGMVGEYKKEAPDPADKEKKILVEKYGLKAFSPIAEGFYFNHSDDFGDSRSFGYKRTHLGNDLIGSVGTPIIAVEGGIIEACGWNRFGGWRLGIRSFDGKRSYYYAHLRRNHPYCEGLKLGSVVKAGQVIGYLGMTGYSSNENYNGMTVPHLHIGMQLIFDESQKEGYNQIWINMYPLMELLRKNKSTVRKDDDQKDYSRVYDIFDPIYPAALQKIPETHSK